MASVARDIGTREQRIAKWRATPGPVITPSLLNCDFAAVGLEIEALEAAGTTAVHLDVMDGHFVPNLSYGPSVIADWRKRTPLYFDAHLMISEPARYLDEYVKAGCDTIIFHIEVEPDPVPLLRLIRAAGCLASLALNPPTPVSSVIPFLDEVDSILIMSVMPGFGGQSFDPSVLPKVETLRSLRPDLHLSIDGGIKPNTAELAGEAGINQLVAGSAVFGRVGQYAAALTELVEGARRGSSRGNAPVGSAGTPQLE